MTQQQLTLVHWIEVRNAAASYTVWRFAQERVDALWRAMGYPPSPSICRLADEELVFPAIRGALEGEA